MSGYDGIASVLTIIEELKQKDTLIDLYVYDPDIVPTFLKNYLSKIIKIEQIFYSRIYSNNKDRMIDRLNFLNAYF